MNKSSNKEAGSLEQEPATRAAYARQQQEEDKSERSELLKKRLDLAIGIVLVLLVLVLFILFKL